MSCVDLNDCVDEYYSNALFLQAGDALWNISFWGNAFMLMVFSHDPWMSFGAAVIMQIATEFLLILSIWTRWNFLRVNNKWEPGEYVFDFLFSIYGVVAGMLFIKLLKSPQLISFTNDPRFKQTKHRISYNIKYLVELTIVQFGASRVFYLSTYSDSVFGNRLFRLDWFLYSLLSIVGIVFMWWLNWTSTYEKKHIWKDKSRTDYNRFYIFLAAAFVIHYAPQVYYYRSPRIMSIISSCISIGSLYLVNGIGWILTNRNRYTRNKKK